MHFVLMWPSFYSSWLVFVLELSTYPMIFQGRVTKLVIMLVVCAHIWSTMPWTGLAQNRQNLPPGFAWFRWIHQYFTCVAQRSWACSHMCTKFKTNVIGCFCWIQDCVYPSHGWFAFATVPIPTTVPSPTTRWPRCMSIDFGGFRRDFSENDYRGLVF